MSDNDPNVVEKAASSVINSTIEGAKKDLGGLWDMAKKVGGHLKEDIKNEVDWLKLSPEEKAEKKAQEEAEANKKKEDEEAAKEAEEQRLKDLQKTYILHTAVILCDKAQHESFVVLPVSHGEFIQGIPQLNISDSKPDINIRSFGICRSASNPMVQEKAKEILKEVDKERPKGFTDKFLGLFTKPGSDVSTNTSDENNPDPQSLAECCAAECTPKISMEWIDGKDNVLVDGKPALLGRCTLTCMQGNGTITIYTSGQAE